MGEGADWASLAGSLPPLLWASAPESGSTLMETEKQTKKFFFRGDGRRGRPGQPWLAVSHPWLGPLPLTPPWAKKKFRSHTRGEGRLPVSHPWLGPLPLTQGPPSWRTLIADKKFSSPPQGEKGGEGRLSVSHPWLGPLPLTQGPPSWRTLIAHKKISSPTQGEKVGCQSPTLAFLCQPHREGPPSWSTWAISYPSNLHTRQVKELKLAPWIGDYPGRVHDSLAPYSTTRA